MTTCPTLWLPAGAAEHIRKVFPSDWTGKRKHLEKVLFALSQVADAQTGRSPADAGRSGGWTSYSVTALGEIVGGTKKATQVRELLEKAGLLEVLRNANGGLSYSVGRFATQVRLPESWAARESVADIITDDLILRNLAAYEREKQADALWGAEKASRQHGVAAFWVKRSLGGLSFDSRVPSEPPAEANGGSETGTGRLRAWKAAIADVGNGAFWLRRHDATGRLFHNASQMPRELRPFLRLDGKPTVELDIANAQPAFLLTEFAGIDPRERDTFAAVVGEGRFYETLRDGLERAATPKQRSFYLGQFDSNRGAFKDSVFKKLLFGASKPEANTMEKALAWRWPGLTSRLREARAEPDGASKLALRLQKAEADLIFGRVLPVLRGMDLGPDWERIGGPS